MKSKLNRIIQIIIDIVIIHTAWLFALVLRFDGKIPVAYFKFWWATVFIITFIRIGFFLYFKLYRSLWQYSSVPEFFLIVKAITVSTAVIWLAVLSANNLGGLPFPIPKALGVIDWILNILMLSGIRFTIRMRREFLIARSRAKQISRKNLLIIGAQETGSTIVKEIFKELADLYQPVGFIDDDPRKQGHQLHGVPVLGSRKDLQRILRFYQINEVIITLSPLSQRDLLEMIEVCQKEKVNVRKIPAITDIIRGKVSVKQLRDIKVEDLLGRSPVAIEAGRVADLITGETVLITGAGGSIGGELSRQIARFQPQKLLLLGRGENSIYEIDQELAATFPNVLKVPIIADVRDRDRLASVFQKYQPTVVFHAAAHKHVPLMERYPEEAVKNNIFGTKNVAELAHTHNCKAFVLISTDKAVNPSSVMGVSKRIAELVVQDLSLHSNTRFMVVRFGNVLGSRGSVVPLFQKQIASGGPVTVTHPEMTRFFMTIPEAAQLVIQAGSLGEGGEVFILDMGEPVKILDLAKQMIKLAGLNPGGEIAIEFSGIRPGEKLYEELLLHTEKVNATQNERIYKSRVAGISHQKLAVSLRLLEDSLNNPTAILPILHKMLAEYQHWQINNRDNVAVK